LSFHLLIYKKRNKLDHYHDHQLLQRS
jgi:hypothetical protein